MFLSSRTFVRSIVDSTISVVCFCLLSAPISLAQGQAQSVTRPGNFKVIGPGGGGSFYNPTISPNDPNTVLVSSDMTGEYITHDGGKSWRMFNLRGVANFFAFDPKAPHTIYADTIGLWRSTNNGDTWKLIYPKPSHIVGLPTRGYAAGITIQAKPDPLGEITALAVDPDNSRTLYAATEKGGKFALFVSHDYGESWQKNAPLPEVARHVWVDPHSPRNARKLVLMGVSSVVVVTGGHVRRVALPGSASQRRFAYQYGRSKFTSAGFTASGQLILYAITESGGSVSTDGGSSWNPIPIPGTGARLAGIATSFHHPETAYLSFWHMALDGKLWFGVLKTADSGRIWNFVWKGTDDAPASNVHDAWLTKRFGPMWGRNPVMMGVGEDNPDLAYATDTGRVMKTTDGGKNWFATYSRRVPGGGWTTTGLDDTSTYSIFFDPFDHNHQFIAYTDIGLFSSNDGGKSWESASYGIPHDWVSTTYWIVFDPKVRGLVWSVNTGDHDLPSPKMWRHESVEQFTGGVCISTDGGRTWKVSSTGMAPTAPTDILLDSTSPVDARVLYVTGFGRGVYKSTNGGKTWVLKNNGITQQHPFAWRIVRDPNGVLFLLIARRSSDGSIGNSGDGAIYKSTDGANSWTPVTLPQGVNAPNGLAVDPRNPERLYLAAWPREAGSHEDGGGVYLSTNGGKSWKPVLNQKQHVYDVTVDPRNPDTVFAAGYDSAAWVSRDRGVHWRLIAGANFHWMVRVIPDPEDPSGVYVATHGGSVWHGDLSGRGPTDIVTPELQPGR